jgi:hypothetical protein
MNTPLPAHLVAGISQRIAWLREVRQIDEIYSHPRHAGYPLAGHRRQPASAVGTAPTNPGATAPTFPQPHSNDARSRS